MRGLAVALWLWTFAACAHGAGSSDDDDGSSSRPDARVVVDGPIGAGPDASTVDGAVTAVDASTDAATDASTTGAVVCPNTFEYYSRAIGELSGPSPRECVAPSDCLSNQCCYGMIVCVPYP